MARVRRPSPQTAAVLAALAEAGSSWSHGYDLCRALGLKAGTVYPILIRLAERGLLETSWEDDPPRGRPARHLYRLTTAGTELARTITTSTPENTPAPPHGPHPGPPTRTRNHLTPRPRPPDPRSDRQTGDRDRPIPHPTPPDPAPEIT